MSTRIQRLRKAAMNLHPGLNAFADDMESSLDVESNLRSDGRSGFGVSAASVGADMFSAGVVILSSTFCSTVYPKCRMCVWFKCYSQAGCKFFR